MDTKSLVISGVTSLAALGALNSCGTMNTMDRSRVIRQYVLSNDDKYTVERYGVSTLKPNGRLSSIEGTDILYFNSKEDSAAYDKMNRLANGVMRRAYVEGHNTFSSVEEEYKKSRSAINQYYNNLGRQDEIEYKQRLGSATKNFDYDKVSRFGSIHKGYSSDVMYGNHVALRDEQLRNKEKMNKVTKSYVKSLNEARKRGKQIIKTARKNLGVQVRKNAIRYI